VVEADIRKAALCTSRDAFIGRSEDEDFEFDLMTTREEFVAERLRLQAEGYDAMALDCEDADLPECWAVFDHLSLTIVGELSVDEAYDGDSGDADGVEVVLVRMFDDVFRHFGL